jgi:acetoin utilization protein AcuC
MSDPRLAFVYSPEVERLQYPDDCPFKTQRAGLTRRRLKSFGLLDGANRFEAAARRATPAELQRFHSARYLSELQRAAGGDLTAEGLRMGLGGPDTPVFKDMFEYGSWACGAALTAAGLLLDHKADVVFNLLGGFHHAMAERAAGFCFLNDQVLACLQFAQDGRRVFYLDLDAHHGDGVQSAFYRRRDVMTVSVHESGKTLFPWGGFEDEIGEGLGTAYNLNVPLPAGTYDDAFLAAVDRVVMPALEAYFPDVIVLELGMDILAGDPLTHLRMTNNVVVEVIERLQLRHHPILVAGGGGYHVENTVRGWALAWRTFCGDQEEYDFGFGMGGVMLGTSEWAGGLRDRALPVTREERLAVEPELRETIERITDSVFRIQGIRTYPVWRSTRRAEGVEWPPRKRERTTT